MVKATGSLWSKAETAEDQTEHLMESQVSRSILKQSYHPKCISYVKIRALVGKTWLHNTWDGDICVEPLRILHSPLNPQSLQKYPYYLLVAFAACSPEETCIPLENSCLSQRLHPPKLELI